MIYEHNHFLPQEFPTASPEHRAYIHNGRIPSDDAARLALEKLTGDNVVTRRKVFAGQIRTAYEANGIQYVHETDPPSTWEEVVSGTNRWLTHHMKDVPLEEYNSLIKVPTVLETGKQGALTVAAFLEVIPRVLARDQHVLDAEETDAVYKYVQRSGGLMTEWSSIDGNLDPELMYAVLEDKPEDIGEIFYKFDRFDPSYFSADHSRMHIVMNAAAVANLESSDGSTLLERANLHRPKVDLLFGCPAIAIIPRLYQFMASYAQLGDLFSKTYVQELALIRQKSDS